MTTGSGEPCVVGVDFGTLSGRAVVVRVSDGEELGAATHDYPHGVLDQALPERAPPRPGLGAPGPRGLPRRAPERGAPGARRSPASTPPTSSASGPTSPPARWSPRSPTARRCASCPTWVDEPHAYVKLWKHHAAQAQADRINELAGKRGEAWLPRYGGLISSEWEFAKGLQVLEEAPEVYAAMDHFVEAADWIVWQLCGRYVRNACTAGYKGISRTAPTRRRDFLAALNPGFADFVADKLDHRIGAARSASPAGSPRRRRGWTGLPEGIAVAVGNVDAHVTAPAARAIRPGQMVAIMGTSTCHVMNGEVLREVPGMCGVVDGGITPGLWGYEAGQCGVGDIFNWFVTTSVPAAYSEEAADRGLDLHELLTEKAAGAGGGRARPASRSTGTAATARCWSTTSCAASCVGQTLATRPEDVYRALLEATAFGTRTIVETFKQAGVPVTEFVVAGGLLKNPLLMQIYADVLDLPAVDHRLRRRGRRSARPSTPRSPPAPTRTSTPPPRRWAGRPRRSTSRSRRTSRPTTSSTPSTARCTTTSAAAPTRSCTGCGTSAAPRSTQRSHERRPRRRARRHPPAARRGRRAARRADPLRAGRLDRRQRLGPRARRGPDGDQAVAGSPTTSCRRRPWWSATSTATSSRATRAELRHRRARLRLPAHARGRRRRAHALDLRHRVGGPGRADPLRADHGWPTSSAATVPVGPFALIGDDSIGRGHRRDTLRGSRSAAVLMQNHGPFTVGSDARAAVKAAVMRRGRRPHGAHRPPAGPAAADLRPSTSTRSTTATRTSTARPRSGRLRRAMHEHPARSGSSPGASTSTAPRCSTRSPTQSGRRRGRPRRLRRASRCPWLPSRC